MLNNKYSPWVPTSRRHWISFYRSLERRVQSRCFKKPAFAVFLSLIVIITVGSCCLRFGKNCKSKDGDFSLSKNYFRRPDKSVLHGSFLINDSNCQIPNFDVWRTQESLRPFASVVCGRRQTSGTVNGLTFVRKQEVGIDTFILKKSMGLEWHDIECCYRTIERINQDIKMYNKSADKKFKYSEECYPMKSKYTTPISGSIKVTCEKIGYFKNTPFHSEFHLLATLELELKSKDNKSTSLHDKIQFWKENAHLPRPPNVLIVGIDSTSRNHFRRMLLSSRDVLEEQFGAIEMHGYSKVGINTFPNAIPYLTSHSMEELTEICYKNQYAAFDDCPFIWKEFSDRKYLTMHLEDAPPIATFHYLKTGFVRPPTDIYPRSWLLAAYGSDYERCIDSRRPDQILFRYIEDVIELAEAQGIPYFINSWLTSLTHNHDNVVRNLDEDFRDMLLRLHKKGFLNNSLLVVMSDHGYRWGHFRRTVVGWYEDKLPFLWIALPNTLKRTFPLWEENLRHNSRQLVTPFDIHATLQHVCSMNSTQPTSTKTRRHISLFDKHDSRTCEEAGIPFQYCPCVMPAEFNSSSSLIWLAADIMVRKINDQRPSKNCRKLRLGVVTAAATLPVNYSQPGNPSTEQDIRGGSQRLILGIETAPGKMNVEAVLAFNATKEDFDILDIFQTNSVGGNRDCVPKHKSGMWCSCKPKPKKSFFNWW